MKIKLLLIIVFFIYTFFLTTQKTYAATPNIFIRVEFSAPSLISGPDEATADLYVSSPDGINKTVTGTWGVDFRTGACAVATNPTCSGVGSAQYFVTASPTVTKSVTISADPNTETLVGTFTSQVSNSTGTCLTSNASSAWARPRYSPGDAANVTLDNVRTQSITNIGAMIGTLRILKADGTPAVGATISISPQDSVPPDDIIPANSAGEIYGIHRLNCSNGHTITADLGSQTGSLVLPAQGGNTPNTICNGQSRSFTIDLSAPSGTDPTDTPVPTVAGAPTATPTLTPTNAPSATPTLTPTPADMPPTAAPIIKSVYEVSNQTTPPNSVPNAFLTQDNINANVSPGDEINIPLNIRNAGANALGNINLTYNIPPRVITTNTLAIPGGCTAVTNADNSTTIRCPNLYDTNDSDLRLNPGSTDSRVIGFTLPSSLTQSQIIIPPGNVKISAFTNPEYPENDRRPSTQWGQTYTCSTQTPNSCQSGNPSGTCSCILAPQGYTNTYTFETNQITLNLPVPSITPPPCPAPVTGTATCTVSGNTGALSFPWTAVSGCTYNIRTNDQEDPWDPVNNTGDTATDGLTSSPFNRNGLKSHTYAWWINSVNSEGIASETVDGNTISCSTASIGVSPQTNTKSATSWQTFTLTKTTLTYPDTDIGFYNPGENTELIGTFPSTGWTRNVGGNCAFTTDGTASCTWNPGNATITPGRHTFGLFGRGQDTSGNDIDGKLLAVTSANFVVTTATPQPTSYNCTLTANPTTGEYPMTTTITLSPVSIIQNRPSDYQSSLTFGDGSTGSFNVTNGQTTHTYTSGGNYTVRYIGSSARDNTYFDCSTSVAVTSPPQPTQPPTAACTMQQANVRAMPWTCRGNECINKIGRAIGTNQVMIGLDDPTYSAPGGGDGYVPSLKPKTFFASLWEKFSSIFQGTAYGTGVNGENFGDFYRNTVNGFLNTSVPKTLIGIQPHNAKDINFAFGFIQFGYKNQTFYMDGFYENFSYFQAESFNTAGSTLSETSGVWVHPDADRYNDCGNFAGWIPSWTLSNMQVYSTTSTSITIAWREVASFTNQHPPFYIVAKSSDQNDTNLANKTGFISSAQLTSQGTPQWSCNGYCVEFPQVTYTFTNLTPGTEYYLGLGYAYPQCHNRTIAPNTVTLTATTQPGIPVTTKPGIPTAPRYAGPHRGNYSTITLDTPLPPTITPTVTPPTAPDTEEGTRIWKAEGLNEPQRWPRNSEDILNTNWRATRYAPDGTTLITSPYYFAIENLDNLEPGDYYYGLYSYSHSVNECRSYSPQVKYSWDGNIVTGHIYFDTNKNGKKDPGEDDYRGPITLTAKKPDGTTVSTFTRTDTCTTDDDCTYTLKRLGNTAGYTITYNGTPNGYSLLHPTTQYTVDFGQSTCDQKYSPNTTPYSSPAGASLGATCGTESLNGLNFGLITKPWIQGTGGDMRNDIEGFTSSIPSTAVNPYASLLGVGATATTGTPGIIFTGDKTARFGGGQASELPFNWVVGGPDDEKKEVFKPALKNVIRTGYGQLVAIAQSSAQTLSCNKNGDPGVGSQTNCDIPTALASGVYKTSGALILKQAEYVFPTVTAGTESAKNYVILVNGDLTIRHNIIVPNGTTATFVVKGDIIIDKEVGVAANAPGTNCTVPTTLGSRSTNCNIEGFYVADGSITIQGLTSPGFSQITGGNCVLGTDKRLNVAGVLVANAGYTTLPAGTVKNERDLCNNNLEYPSLSLVERPDFIINMPLFLKHTDTRWQEVIP